MGKVIIWKREFSDNKNNRNLKDEEKILVLRQVKMLH